MYACTSVHVFVHTFCAASSVCFLTRSFSFSISLRADSVRTRSMSSAEAPRSCPGALRPVDVIDPSAITPSHDLLLITLSESMEGAGTTCGVLDTVLRYTAQSTRTKSTTKATDDSAYMTATGREVVRSKTEASSCWTSTGLEVTWVIGRSPRFTRRSWTPCSTRRPATCLSLRLEPKCSRPQ